ncbi:MAG: hypothetical protein IKL04_07540 [Lachnospiraceae bacterium]|nr:hypothetical protein [Lachnospiraceae bacterium]
MLVSQLTEAELTDDIIDRLLYAGLVDTCEGIQRARNEALNIINCVQNGVFPDFEILS